MAHSKRCTTPLAANDTLDDGICYIRETHHSRGSFASFDVIVARACTRTNCKGA